MDEVVTLRCEGSIATVRALRRRLEAEGLSVTFGTLGIVNDERNRGRAVVNRWFQLVVRGGGSTAICQFVIDNWADGGRLMIV